MGQKIKRPFLLEVQCILTFVGSVWGALTGIFMGLAAAGYESIKNDDAFMEQWEASLKGYGEAGEMVLNNWDAIYPSLPTYAFLLILVNIFAFVGALKMYRFNKKGFFFYTTAVVAEVLITPYFMGGLMSPVSSGTLLTIIFIVGYATQLKHMDLPKIEEV